MESGLSSVREALVLAHVDAENRHDVDAVLETFARPRYEIVPTGAIYEGAEAVRAMLLAQWDQLPQLRFEAEAVFHAESGLVVETRTTLADDTGRNVAMRSMNLFGFEGPDLVLERSYFDRELFADCFVPAR